MNPFGVLARLIETEYRVIDAGDGLDLMTKYNKAFGQVQLVSGSGAETRTMGDPTDVGHYVSLYMLTDGGGDITVTFDSGYDQAGSTTMVFGDVGDNALFMSVQDSSTPTYRWQIVSYDGVTGPTLEIASLDLDALTVSGTAAVTGVTTLSSNLVLPSFSTPVEAAEHGAGAIGTAVAPATYRWSENGTIITEIKVDLTGLDSSGTENDVIGLSTGGAAYLGRYVVATCGVLYRVEMSCLEVPLSGDADVILVGGSAADEAFDDTVANTVAVCDGTGDWTLGETIVNNAPAGLVANYYLYLTQGATDDATYTAGQFLIRLYGHAPLA